MIVEHNESQPQTMALRPKLARSEVRGPNAQGYALSAPRQTPCGCPSSYKLGHKVGLSYGGSGSSVGLIMQPAFDVASVDTRLSVS